MRLRHLRHQSKIMPLLLVVVSDPSRFVVVVNEEEELEEEPREEEESDGVGLADFETLHADVAEGGGEEGYGKEGCELVFLEDEGGKDEQLKALSIKFLAISPSSLIASGRS